MNIMEAVLQIGVAILNIGLRTRYTTTGTATQNIAMELILDGISPANFGAIVMSAEEIAQSDYALAGGGSDSSSSNGGIGSDPGVIAKSNFSELLPDRINVPIIRGSQTQEDISLLKDFSKD